MTVTVHLGENRGVRVTDEIVETHPPDRIEFAVEGVISTTDGLLARFEGTTLDPVSVAFSVADSETVAVDLAGTAALRLDALDVGVETPDADDLSPGLDGDDSSADEPTAARPGAIAFTVEGAIRDVPAATLESVADGTATLASITFAVEESVRSDGGSADDALFEFTLLGYGIGVRRDGTIDIGSRGSVAAIDL